MTSINFQNYTKYYKAMYYPELNIIILAQAFEQRTPNQVKYKNEKVIFFNYKKWHKILNPEHLDTTNNIKFTAMEKFIILNHNYFWIRNI